MYKVLKCSYLQVCVSTWEKGVWSARYGFPVNTDLETLRGSGSLNHAPGSPVLVIFGLLAFLSPLPDSYFTNSLTREISVPTLKI